MHDSLMPADLITVAKERLTLPLATYLSENFTVKSQYTDPAGGTYPQLGRSSMQPGALSPNLLTPSMLLALVALFCNCWITLFANPA